MVWSCFSASGVGPVFWIREKMCAPDYLNILNSVMLPYAEDYMPLRWEFMHDNDSKHASRIIKSWLERNQVALLDWPSQFPDLNPIEHLWRVLKTSIGGQKWKNKQELWEKIQEAWYSIPVKTCAQLVNSMPRRCQEVMKNKGASTKY